MTERDLNRARGMRSRDIHAEALATSAELCAYQVEGAIPPIQLITVLDEADIKSVLVGTHALGGWMRKPRASQDVDLAVSARQHKKAVRTLLDVFPQLSRDEGDSRLKAGTGKNHLVDVKKADRALYRAIFANTRRVSLGGARMRDTFSGDGSHPALCCDYGPSVERPCQIPVRARLPVHGEREPQDRLQNVGPSGRPCLSRWQPGHCAKSCPGAAR